MEYNYYLSNVDIAFKIKIGSLEGITLPAPVNSNYFPEYPSVASYPGRDIYIRASLHALGQQIGASITTRSCSYEEGYNLEFEEWLSFPVTLRDLPGDTLLLLAVCDPTTAPASNVGTDNVFAGTSVRVFGDRGVMQSGTERIALVTWTDAMAVDLTMAPPAPDASASPRTEAETLDRLLNTYRNRPLPRVPWLDRMLLKHVGTVCENGPDASLYPGSASAKLFLTLEYPPTKAPVVYAPPAVTLRPPLPVLCSPHVVRDFQAENKEFANVAVFGDAEQYRDNPIEDKYFRSSRMNAGNLKNLKPSIEQRNQIERILISPNRVLTPQERSLIWRFRYSLMENPKALPKFLRCVDWTVEDDTVHAVSLMKSWKRIEPADSLELLSRTFRHPEVRVYAVQILDDAKDDELQLYLLQLVQALKFDASYPSELSLFLIQRCSNSVELANFFHWFVKVETSDVNFADLYANLFRDFQAALQGNERTSSWVQEVVQRQEDLVTTLIELSARVREKKKVDDQKELLRALLSTGQYRNLMHFDSPIMFAVRPEIFFEGIIPERCSVFTSAKTPLKLTFRVANVEAGEGGGAGGGGGGEHKELSVIFKSGDDLRQDQLVIQLINMMDAMLKQVGLDLRLTPYRVLATSVLDGYVEMVEQVVNLSEVVQSKKIKDFLTDKAKKATQINAVMDNYVKSCAGYAVITYILGIGDRHLDNIMIKEDGHLFHIDFGYILGDDPKPFPAKIRITQEMIEAMDTFYPQFITHCCSAFNTFRKNAPLIMNLLELMTLSGIRRLSPDYLETTLAETLEKFRLDLEDEEASQFLINTINESMSALAPDVWEKLHIVAKWFR